MTTTPEMESRVTKLHEEVDALYDIGKKTHNTVTEIAAVQQLHGRILEKHSGRLDRMEAKQDEHTEKLDTILGLLGPDGPDT